MAIHSRYGFCNACFGQCKYRDIYDGSMAFDEDIRNRLYQEPNTISELFELLSKKQQPQLNFDGDANFYNQIMGITEGKEKDKCTCYTGYNILCPIHGIGKV